MKKHPWNITKLSSTPKVWNFSREDLGKHLFYTEAKIGKRCPGGVYPIWYESEKYQNHQTRVFAWMGMPEQPSKLKVPAIVLVHGGGGTAFAHWVKMWNRRGYAAIALDMNGHIPSATQYRLWQKHEYSGPDQGNVFNDIDLPVKQQWPYHAVSAIIRANSLLRSLQNVDKKKIGICGISWGGYLVSIAIGIDNRFKFAILNYGCGYLQEGSAWEKDLFALGTKKRNKWLKNWDPSVYLPFAKLPTIWITGSNDPCYNLKMLNMSKRCHGGNPLLSIGVRHAHCHTSGWNRPEADIFADHFCKGNKGLIRILNQGQKNGRLFVKYSKKEAMPKKAWLCYTKDDGPWPNKYWRRHKAVICDGVVTSDIPSEMKICFFNLISKDGCKISSDLIYVGS